MSFLVQKPYLTIITLPGKKLKTPPTPDLLIFQGISTAAA